MYSNLKPQKNLGSWHGSSSYHGHNLLDELNAVTNSSKSLKFVILGAGMAGLCAAYELEKRGHTCVILEAESGHVGGRVRTLHFGDGLYGEAGAMRIPEVHYLTRHYIKELGLSLRRFVNDNPEAYCYLRGQRERVQNVDQLRRLYQLEDHERQLTSDDIWIKAVASHLATLTEEEIAQLRFDLPKTKTILNWDRQSLRQMFDESGFSEEAIKWLGVVYGLETFMSTSALEHIRQEYDQVWLNDFDEIVGGTEQLPLTMIDRLKSKPRMGCEVVRLERDDESHNAAAVYLDKDQPKREVGDFVLCTIPAPVLARLDTPFSPKKQRAIRNLHYDSAIKVFAISDRRFWESDDRIFGGGSISDLPLTTTYYPSDNAQTKDSKISAQPGVMLASYTRGAFARRLGSFSLKERHYVVQEALKQLHPQFKSEGMLRSMVSWNWNDYKWTGGSYSFFMPGQHSALHQHIIAPEGRIFFAGEHASLDHSWIQGALESSLRAVKSMLLAAG
ncbi:MAG: NAD(P)/FAD-dependent oxidoreductase [Cyanobacteria bacterium P01_G01_bin.39]